MSKASSRYTWTRNSDDRGKSVLGSVNSTIGPSARTSVFSGHSPKPKSKNRVWRPNGPTEKSGRSPGRRPSTAKAPVPSTKGKDRPCELSLGSSAIHKRRRAAGLHGNRVWVPPVKAASAVCVKKGPSTASLSRPDGVDAARERVLGKHCTSTNDVVGITSASAAMPTARSSLVGGRVSERVVQVASAGKRKRRHGNLVWRPGQTGVPVASSEKLHCVTFPSRGAVLRRSRDGALHTTKYRWQRKLSAGSQSPPGIYYNGQFMYKELLSNSTSTCLMCCLSEFSAPN